VAEPAIELRSAEASEFDAAVSCVVAAFLTDPITRYAWPRAHDHLQHFPKVVRAIAGAGLEHGAAWVTADFCGAALWVPPGARSDSETAGRVMGQTITPAHRDDMFALFEEMEKHHPHEPHWYLPFIGVEPNAQGRGLGAALMKHALARCDREGALAYLESSNPRNISLYERHGFVRVAELRVGKEGPIMTPMLRQPRR
jgi:ribosomal protein S18 acetylase RimI-like enzyme